MENKDTQKKELVFLKLGGSLITNKPRPSTPRLELMDRLTQEIAAARSQNKHLSLVLGHGSGSFGHVPAKKYGTRQGVSSAADWGGFVEVWHQAANLNHLMMAALQKANIPAISFAVSASTNSINRELVSWDITPLQSALENSLVPVVYGDVVFDTKLGGTILSTEDIFSYLTHLLKPMRILLAGIEFGVWADYPECTQIVEKITPQNVTTVSPALSGSNATDVTGGMASKVKQMLALTEEIPNLEIMIFSGEPKGSIVEGLLGKIHGTRISAD